MRNDDNDGGYACIKTEWEVSVLSSHYYCGPKTALKKSITRDRERGETSNKIITGREDDSRGNFSLVLFLSILEQWRKIFNVLNIPQTLSLSHNFYFSFRNSELIDS